MTTLNIAISVRGEIQYIAAMVIFTLFLLGLQTNSISNADEEQGFAMANASKQPSVLVINDFECVSAAHR